MLKILPRVVIGFFVNTLVLRLQLDESSSFEQVLRQVREITLDSYAHQDAPFEQVVERLQPTRSLSHSPLFQAMFAFENTLDDVELVLSGVTQGGLQALSGEEQNRTE